MTKSEKAKDLVKFDYCELHQMEDDSVEVLEVWHCYVLGNEKWMFALAEDGILCEAYYEVTYNKAKDEFYVDHYYKYSKQTYPNT